MDFLFDISALLSFLLLYKYVALFCCIFLGAIGLPFPSNTMLLAVGAFASQNYFNFGIAFLVAFIANVSGDWLEYWVARNYGAFLISKQYHRRFRFFVRLEPSIRLMETYISEHEGAAVFFTRFLGTANTITNIWSGLLPISFKKFIVFDALGNSLDIVGVLLIGFFLSDSWQSIAGLFGTATTAISVIILLVFCFAILRKVQQNRRKAQ